MLSKKRSVLSIFLAVTIVLVEIEHVLDYFWEKSPPWAHSLIMRWSPAALLCLGLICLGFLLGLLCGLIYPGMLDRLRNLVRRRLSHSGGAGFKVE